MEEKKRFWFNGIKYVGITLGVYAAIRWLLPYVLPFLIALLLAKWIFPAVSKCKKGRKLLGSMLLILCFLGVAAAAVLGIYALSFPCQRLINHWQSITGNCMRLWEECCCKVEDTLGIRLDGVVSFWQQRLGGLEEQVEQNVLHSLMGWSAKSIQSILSGCGVAIVTVVASFYILHDYESIRERAYRSDWGSFLVSLGRGVLGTLGIYLRTQLIIIAAVSAICVVALWICKNPYALVIGILIGICDALPFFGTGTIFVPWAVIDLIRGKYGLACVYGLLYALCTFVREILEPRLMGEKLNVHPVAIMISIYVGLCVYGITGVLLGPVSLILIKKIGQYKTFGINR